MVSRRRGASRYRAPTRTPPGALPYRIFVVEDHPTMRAAYALMLGREPDFEVCRMVGSAEEALDVFDGLDCDLVIADVSLPGMDGIEMTEHLRARWPGLPVLVVSAHTAEVHVRRALGAGAHAFIDKKEVGHTLAGAIREALSGRAPGAGLHEAH